MAAQLRVLRAQLSEQQQASGSLEAQLAEQRALARQLRAEHVRLHEQRHEQRPQRPGQPLPLPQHLRHQAARGHATAAGGVEHEAGRMHTVDMPSHCNSEAQRQAGTPKAALHAFGFTQTRASIWSPVWSLLAGLANVGRSRSHQLMSV